MAVYPGSIPGKWDVSDDELDSWLEEWEAVDRAIEDPDGQLAALDMTLLHLTPLWQDIGVLDADQQLTQRGVWGLSKAHHLGWTSGVTS